MSDSIALTASPPQSHQGAPLRSDGVEARNRLLMAALPLFAANGFTKTSTREIAKAAGMNLASIAYYFGDKAGLYRAVFTDPHLNPHAQLPQHSGAAPDLETVVRHIVHSFVDPLKQGEQAQQCMKLYYREMLEPTGIWQDEIETSIRPMHGALTAALARHLGLAAPDDEVRRLAFAIAGLGVMVQLGHEVVSALAPQLIDSHAALDVHCERLVGYAMALVQAESARRASLPPPVTPFSRPNHQP